MMIMVILFAGLVLFTLSFAKSPETAFSFLLIFSLLLVGMTMGVSSSEEFIEYSGRKINSFD